MTGDNLKTRRERLKLSQEGLARKLDVSLSTVARWEQLKGLEIPNSRMLELALSGLENENKASKGKGK